MSRIEWKLLFWLTWTALLVVTAALCEIAHADVRYGTASWYSVASCKKEGTSGIMANGRKLNDQAFTAASWDYPFGTRLNVCADAGARCQVVTVADRGPAKRLYRQGRILDLSQAAFEAIAPLSVGVISVTVEALP